MPILRHSLSIILFIFSPALATIIRVPQDRATIQMGIDATIDGDTVLVDTGRYVEKINFNGKNIVVGSLFLTTGDTSYTSQTVIDGDRNGHVVTFENGEDSSAVFTGFTVTNGYANGGYEHNHGGGIFCSNNSNPKLVSLLIRQNAALFSGGGIYCSDSGPMLESVEIENNLADLWGGGVYCGEGSDPYLRTVAIKNNHAGAVGGGIACAFDASPRLANMIISGNSAYWSGGGLVSYGRSNIYLENVSISGNSANDYGGGVYIVDSSQVTFDSENRSSVYLNHAGSGSDLYLIESPTVHVTVDSFSVPDPTDYYAHPRNHFSFDIAHSVQEQVNSDLYVSPNGDNTNSGQSPSDPLLNISFALSKSLADSLNPRVIYIAEGVYSPSQTGELFPLNTVSHVSLRGESWEHVILDAEGKTRVLLFDNDEGIIVENLTVKGGSAGWGGGIACYNNSNPSLSNVIISGNRSTYGGGGAMACYNHSSPYLHHVRISGNEATGEHAGFGGAIYCQDDSNPILVKVTVSDNYARNTGGAFHCKYSSTPILVNCTVVGNSAYYSGGGMFGGSHSGITLVNSIFWDNLPDQINLSGWGRTGTITVAHSDVQGGDTAIVAYRDTVNWLDSNIDLDPMFVDPESGDFQLQQGSPAIDAGTALFVWEADTLVNLPDTAYEGNAPDMGAFESPFSVGLAQEDVIPFEFALRQNYPNPFNPATTIEFSVPQAGLVTLTVYDLLGREVESIINKEIRAGHYKVQWNASEFPSGIYFVRMQAGPGQVFTQARKVTVLR